MFKKVFSLLLCILMCITCFSATAIEVAAVSDARSLFAVTSSPVKNGTLKYTINVTAQQKNIAGVVLYVQYDSSVLKPIDDECGPAETKNTSLGTVQNFEGTFIHGVTEGAPKYYSIAYMNKVAQSTNASGKAFFNMSFEVIDASRPKTDITFYCKEYYSTSETDKNITVDDGLQVIQEYKGVTTLEAPVVNSIVPFGTGFKLSWKAVTGADGYIVYRSTPSSGKEKVGECSGNSNTTFTNEQLKSGVSYTYTITAVNNKGSVSIESSGLTSKYIAKPSISSVKNVAGGVEIKWTKTDGAMYYNVMRRAIGETVWTQVATRSAALDTSFVDSTVKDSVEYEYDVNSVTDSFTSASAAKGVSIIYIKTPVFTSVSNTISGIELKWPAHSSAAKYVIYKRTIGVDASLVQFAETPNNSYLDTNTEAGKAYTYSVAVVTNRGSSAYNTAGYTITRVPPTEVTALTVEKNAINIQWKSVNGIDGYNIYRKPISSDKWEKAGTVNKTVLSFKDSGAVSGTQYVYAVTPVLNNSEGAKVASNVIYYIKAPTNVVATNEVDGVKIKWDRVGGAVSYVITRTDSYNNTEKVATVQGNNNVSYIDKNVKNGVTYTYNVVAVNTLGESKQSDKSNSLYRWNEAINTTPVLAEGGIKVTWQTKANAQGYVVYRCVDNVWAPIGETKTAEYLDKNVVSNKTYSYAVGMIINGSVSAVHKPAKAQLRYIAPANEITTANGSNYTKVSWKAVDGATKYYLYKSISENGKYELVGTFNSNVLSYVDKDVTAGGTYYYKTRCYNGVDTSVYSTAKRSVFIEIPKITSVVNVYGGQTFKWGAVKGATGYRVYRKIYGEKYYTYITTVDAKTLSYTDTGCTNGKIMCYTVKAVNGDSASAYLAKCMTYVIAPTPAMSNSPSGVYLKWDKNPAAVGYWVYRKTPQAKYWTRIACVKTLYYTDATVKSGTEYLYTVKAYTGKILSGCNMNGWKITHLATPQMTSVANGYGAVTCFWKAVPGAKSYNVYRKADGAASWTYVGNTTALLYRDTNVKSLSTYTYTVRAVNGSNISSFNYAGKSVKYLTAPTISISNSTTGVYLQWNRISGASSYYIYRKAGNAKSWTKIDTVTGNSYLDTNVKAGVAYTYTIRANGSKTLSGCNSYGWKTVYLNTPKVVSVLSYPGGVTVKWQKVPVATWYAVFRKADGDKSWTLIGKTTGNASVTYVDKTAKQGTTYTYTVRACYGNYRSWFQSGIKCKV